jgi:peptidoglycan/xylan/chitin deacetylase (PgdA/CDA1 family)
MLPGQNGSVELSDARQRGDLAKSLFNEAQSYANDRDAQYAWLGEIAIRLGVDWGAVVGGRLFHLMTGAEVADVARRGFDIQLHTHRHRTPRERAVFLEEVRENRRILQEFTGHPTTHFCYPSGDVDPLFLPWLRELNVETATTTVPDLARPGDDPLLLPRFVDTMAQPEVMFEGWLSGARSILKRLSA